MSRELLRALPQVEKALRWPEVAELLERHPRPEVVRAVRGALESIRRAVSSPPRPAEAPADGAIVSRDAVVERTRELLTERKSSSYRKVINGTGIILHTGLGRAVLAPEALEAVEEKLSGYSLVEVDPESGERNERETGLRELLAELTGAESATIVNNNAAATLLILAALARGKEVVLSRGQMVEIGGSFRIPEILEESGARLVGVGTTNRTYLRDYERAIGPETGLLLEVHTSNYALRGFVHHTPLEELVRLGATRGLPVVSDLGSGCFVDVARFGFEPEPLVRDTVAKGPDLVCFSGDKLLGGPQAGVIVGKAQAVARVRAHPLFRTLRVDKVTLALMEATLRLYRDPERVLISVPVLRLLSRPVAEIRRRASAFLERLEGLSPPLRLECTETAAQAGSGSLPDQELPSWALSIAHETVPARELARSLRERPVPVFTRVHGERVLVDFRTVLETDEEELAASLRSLTRRRSSPPR